MESNSAMQRVNELQMNQNLLVIIPTYNEVDAVQNILEELNYVKIPMQILFVDDSPNLKTYDAINVAKINCVYEVTIIHRNNNQNGIAGAYQLAYQYAEKEGFAFCIQLDADGQHRPSEVKKIYSTLLETGGMVIGSRYTEGGKVQGWSRYRKLVSRVANFYFRVLFHPNIKDCTSGFRGFETAVLSQLWKSAPSSRRFSVHAETTLRAIESKSRITEVPITFDGRSSGESKMSISSGIESLVLFTRWRLLK
jgi:dolichol-phosphate mannosyltransferase